MSGNKMYMSGSKPYKSNVCLPEDYKAGCRAKSHLFNFPNKSICLKTASNNIQLGSCNIQKILKIVTHKWNIIFANFVWRTKTVVSQSSCQLKIFILRLDFAMKFTKKLKVM